jgi:hypothetical protein
MRVTLAQMRAGTSQGAFHFTSRQKQKPQSNTRLLWGLEGFFEILIPGQYRGDKRFYLAREWNF